MSTKIYVGNALEVLPKLEENSIHCSVGSPPYYSLRRYSGNQQCEWPEIEYSLMPGLPPIKIEAMTCALGHEKTIEAYVGHLVAIYREVYKILRGDGCCFIVMGDSFAANRSYQVPDTKWRDVGNKKPPRVPVGLKQGNLMMVPHRLALALQADKWIVRNDCVFAKKAPMPESVAGWRWERHRIKVRRLRKKTTAWAKGSGNTSGNAGPGLAYNPWNEYGDCPGCPKCEENGGYVLKRGSWRHTRAHEFVLMLCKNMQYFADQEKVREALPQSSIERYNYGFGGQKNRELKNGDKPTAVVGSRQPTGRNPRSVLCPSPEPFPGRHFAVFPTSLIESLIKATCPDKCCPECGKGWAPTIEKTVGTLKECPKTQASHLARGGGGTLSGTVGKSGGGRIDGQVRILDCRPTCECFSGISGEQLNWDIQMRLDEYAPIPGTCLDPFGGSGTTGLVCERLGLNSVLVEISQEYAEMARDRIVGEAPLLNNVEVVNNDGTKI